MELDRSGEARADALRSASPSLYLFLERDRRARELLEVRDIPDERVYQDDLVGAWNDGGIEAVRLQKRRRLLQIAALDLAGELSFERVGSALSALADACLHATLLGLDGPSSLAVVALGKLGAEELNYVSDIDVMFVAGDDLERSTRAAEELLAAVGGYSPEGRAYIIDASLRPEGRSGVLVRSRRSALEYYERYAQPWELQALIKARTAAGALDVGDAFVAAMRSLVFPQAVSTERVAAIRRMKERVEEHAVRSARRSSADDDVKLGPGGIRDIEFSTQLLQLVHGGSDPAVRRRDTLGALAALVEGGYVADDDGAGLALAYRWLRAVEHRLQLYGERRVRTLPRGEDGRARLARTMRLEATPWASAAERFDTKHRAVLADVRSRFEKLFYRPLIESLSEAGAGRLSQDALRERLRILGFRDAERAGRTLGNLVAGTSRRAKVLRVLTPAMLRDLASTPSPDDGLLSFLRLGESLGMRLDALGGLRDNPPGLALLARVLGSGRLMGELLIHVPEELTTIAEGAGPPALKARDQLVREAVASLRWREPERRLDGLRRFKRREMVRVAVVDLARDPDVSGIGGALSALADACLEAALRDIGASLAVIALGKLGAREPNYASDIDVMFVHGDDQQAAERAAEALVRAVGEVTPEGQAFRVDLGLRPEGRVGPLVRSLEATLEYYERWAKPWERLALTRARAAAGDAELGDAFVKASRDHAYPPRVDDAALSEIRHLKARMERERVPRGTDPRRNIKLGPGGLADVEFAVGILQLRHAHALEGLRTTSTLEALAAAARGGLLDPGAASRLDHAYRFLARLRNRLYLLVGRPLDVLPDAPEPLEAAGIAMGFTEQPRQELEEAFLRATRRAGRVARELIYG